ncbi:hypothetical protein [Amycolatopsis silviterrae]|uniref:Uncharacterized protein n=1 Tax=Amycolatopsis silviterrae TaxID=1656914 RepID=A0ABW5H3Q6_9PSEU
MNAEDEDEEPVTVAESWPATWIDEDHVECVGIGDSHLDDDPWPD